MDIDTLCAGNEVSDKRREALEIASELGADDDTLIMLRDALRVNRSSTIVLPAHHYESLSRGRGWARKGKGSSTEWGERVGNGYKVGPGRWTVGGHDGFSRKWSDVWSVKHLKVGDQTWTIAD